MAYMCLISIAVSNTFKLEKFHGMVIYKHHNPLQFTLEQVSCTTINFVLIFYLNKTYFKILKTLQVWIRNVLYSAFKKLQLVYLIFPMALSFTISSLSINIVVQLVFDCPARASFT